MIMEQLEFKKDKYKVLNEIAKKCRQWREDTGLSMESIARLVGVTRQAISSFEQGKTDSEIILYYYIVLGVKL